MIIPCCCPEIISVVQSAIYQLIGFILNSLGLSSQIIAFLELKLLWLDSFDRHSYYSNVDFLTLFLLSLVQNIPFSKMIANLHRTLLLVAEFIVPLVLVSYSKGLKHKLHCLSALSLVFCTLTTKIVYQ